MFLGMYLLYSLTIKDGDPSGITQYMYENCAYGYCIIDIGLILGLIFVPIYKELSGLLNIIFILNIIINMNIIFSILLFTT
jgi:hypothetical protein